MWECLRNDNMYHRDFTGQPHIVRVAWICIVFSQRNVAFSLKPSRNILILLKFTSNKNSPRSSWNCLLGLLPFFNSNFLFLHFILYMLFHVFFFRLLRFDRFFLWFHDSKHVFLLIKLLCRIKSLCLTKYCLGHVRKIMQYSK